jgi:predicted RNA-binding protein YlxR (DUF448 family)
MTPALDTAVGPIRTCIGCRRRAAKNELLRVVAGSDAGGQPVISPDPNGRAPGRGAHLHPTSECLDQAVRRRAFTRALRVTVTLSDVPLREHLATTSQHD